MISNLHSLFNRPWYIEQNYGMSHLPLLFGILDGKSLEIKSTDKKRPEFTKMNSMGIYSGEEESAQKFVSVISIKTPIYKYSQECGPRGTKFHQQVMDRLKTNDQVAGVVLDVDSGGGQAYGTPEFRDYILNYPKPVVTYTDGLLCSAAYYFASGSKEIIANKRAEAIGSIGAYAQFLDLTGFYESKGAKIHTLYADQSSEKNKSYRDILEGNYKTYIKEDLNPLVDNFIADIKETRPNIKDEVFKGATYPGPEAKEKGLIDSLGTLQDAVDRVFALDKSNSNSTNTMSKQNSRPNIENALGLESPLANSEKGTYLNDEQLDSLEAALAPNAEKIKTAQDAQKTAEDNLATEKDERKKAVDAETAKVTAATQNLRDAATLAGVENLTEDASAEDIAKALTAQIEVLNGKPGATHTTGGAQEDDEDETPSYVDRAKYKALFKK